MPRSSLLFSQPFTLAIVVGSVGLSTHIALAQSWQAGSAASNVNGTVVGLKMWDADGAGGNPAVLAAMGVFTAAGSTSPANHIATWDGTNWSTFAGTGLVYSGTSGGLATLPSNNNLFVVGTGLTSANSVPTKGVAGWDGTSWFGLSSSSVTALVGIGTVGTDSIVVTGVFTSINGVPANRVATWNPTTGWAALDDGVNNGISSTGASCIGLSNGNIIVGGAGDFTGVSGGSGAGPLQINRIGRWDGSWHTMGAGFTAGLSDGAPAGLARCLLELPNGDVVAGGSIQASGSTALNKIGRWDHVTNTWQPFGVGINNQSSLNVNNRDVYAMVLMQNGDLVVGGDFNTAGGATQNYIARWNFTTSTWSGLAPGDVGLGGPVRSLAVLPNGDLAVGGDFLTAGGQPAQRFAIWHEPVVVATPPVITVQPTADFLCIFPGGVADLAVTATGPGLTYQWQQQDLGPTFPDFINITDGPVPDIFGNPIFTASGATTNHLTLTNGAGYAQVFRVVVSNSAGHVESSEATVSYCHPDFNCSGTLEVLDIFEFLNAWFMGDVRADYDFMNGLGVPDIFEFLNEWFLGC